MLTNLGQLWTSTGRKAEQTDTRQHIVRQKPDQQRRDQNEPEPQEPKEDLAEASIDSLILFLQSALPENDSENTIPAAESPPATETAKHNKHAAAAANAYQNASGQRRAPAKQERPASQARPSKLSAEEVKTIHTLLNDLRNLQENGTRALPIRDGENFLDSLVQAIRRARHN